MSDEFTNPGLIEDPRSLDEKSKDYMHQELFLALPLVWKEKTDSELPAYEIRNQNGSGQCVAFSAAKVLGINNLQEHGIFPRLSPRDIYMRRFNKDSPGMWLQDAGEIMRKYGATLDSLVPSDLLTEAQANKSLDRTTDMVNEALKYRIKNYVFTTGIDGVAQSMETLKKNGIKGGVMICLRFDIPEWTAVPQILKNVPRNRLYDDLSCGHCVTAVDYMMYEGEKALLIEDSWGTSYGKAGRRIIKESFFNARNNGAMYTIDLESEVPLEKPSFSGKTVLNYGTMNNTDVSDLQDVLKYEALMPGNIDSTGNYLELTRKGVLQWQIKHNVADMAELTMLNGRRVGPKTLAKLKELYG